MLCINKLARLIAPVSMLALEPASAADNLEFVVEHLPEIGMDNRYASLPIWTPCDSGTCFSVNAGYARTHSRTLSMNGATVSLGFVRPVGERFRVSGFVFVDDFTLRSGTERRILDPTFADPPLALPADAEFNNLRGAARDYGVGFALNGSLDWSWLPPLEWSTGAMWQKFRLSDYRFDYRVLGGPDAGATGAIDYGANYSHFSPFVGFSLPMERGDWRLSPHMQLAVPLPRRGLAGHMSGPGFDLSGNADDNGAGKHFGDPSVTIGFNITYEPWDLTVDLGSTFTQALVEPRIHEGVGHNLLFTGFWTF